MNLDAQLHEYVDNMSTFNAKVDPTGRFLFINRAAQMASGFSESELKEINFLDGPWWNFDPEVKQRVSEAFTQALRGHHVVYDEKTQVAGKKIITINFSLMPVKNEDGSIRYLIAEGRDISKQKEAEDELRRSEERFRILIEQVKEYAIFMLDSSGKIVSWNQGAKNINGYDAHEIIGKHFSIFYLETDKINMKPEKELEIAASTGKFEEEGVRLKKDGTRYWASVVITALRNADGSLRGFVKVTRDISERIQAQRELEQLNASLESRVESRTRELRKSNLELEQFAYVASHDLQEPLRTISNWAQLLKRDFASKLPVEAAEYIEFISNGAVRMSQLVRDLMEYSRVSASEVATAPASTLEMVEEAVQNLEKAIQENNAKVEMMGTFPDLAVDKTQFIRVFQNLIGNSIKFKGPKNPEVKITANEDDSKFTFSVEDNGIGIDMKYSQKVFEIFRRLHTRDEYPGNGIGLSVAKKIIERHGGKIWVESIQGQGAKFYFTVPKELWIQNDTRLTNGGRH